MSTFYGMVQGNRGAATRGGSRASGFKASVQSWDGSIITQMSYDKDDNLTVDVSYSTGSSCYGTTIFHGTFDEYVMKLRA
jgi:hypothetical protein